MTTSSDFGFAPEWFGPHALIPRHCIVDVDDYSGIHSPCPETDPGHGGHLTYRQRVCAALCEVGRHDLAAVYTYIEPTKPDDIALVGRARLLAWQLPPFGTG